MKIMENKVQASYYTFYQTNLYIEGNMNKRKQTKQRMQ